jgi:hypothetical protein
MARSEVNRATARSSQEDSSRAKELHRKFRKLVEELGEIDEQIQSGTMIDHTTGTKFSDVSAAKRMGMIKTVDAVCDFLRVGGAPYRILFLLSYELQQLRSGFTSGALTATRLRAGRKLDRPKISELKGRIVGIARLRMASGESRNDAIAWVARKIPDRLASELSSKPIKASTVKEWMDNFDCGAKILDLFASEEMRKDFESLFPDPTAADEGEDSINWRKLAFLRAHVPEHKNLINSRFGLMGFMIEIYCYQAGYRPSFDRLFAELEELAVGLTPSDPSAATNL